MPFCPYCKAEVGEDSKFCHSCGRRIREELAGKTRIRKRTLDILLGIAVAIIIVGVVVFSGGLEKIVYNITLEFKVKPIAKELTEREGELGQFITETGKAFDTGELSSLYRKEFKDGKYWKIEPDLITEENGFSPLARFWVETDWQISYFYKFSEYDKKRMLHANPWLHAYLYFWEHRWANMPEDIQPLVEALATKYDIPRLTVRALQELPDPEAPSPAKEELSFEEKLRQASGLPEEPLQRWEKALKEAGLR